MQLTSVPCSQWPNLSQLQFLCSRQLCLSPRQHLCLSPCHFPCSQSQSTAIPLFSGALSRSTSLPLLSVAEGQSTSGTISAQLSTHMSLAFNNFQQNVAEGQAITHQSTEKSNLTYLDILNEHADSIFTMLELL